MFTPSAEYHPAPVRNDVVLRLQTFLTDHVILDWALETPGASFFGDDLVYSYVVVSQRRFWRELVRLDWNIRKWLSNNSQSIYHTSLQISSSLYRNRQYSSPGFRITLPAEFLASGGRRRSFGRSPLLRYAWYEAWSLYPTIFAECQDSVHTLSEEVAANRSRDNQDVVVGKELKSFIYKQYRSEWEVFCSLKNYHLKMCQLFGTACRMCRWDPVD
jgi:hypothetical protein